MAGTNTTTIELLKKYDFPIQKKYGQNFLIDDNILNGIVNAAEVSEGDTVLEIGPGLGALTGALCRAASGGRVIAVEVDKMLIPILNETLQDYDNLTIINQDILKVDIGSLLQEGEKNIKVVANLPYYITTPVIMELLEHQSRIRSITVMIQKEVAERMQEGPGSKSYGALSLAVQFYSKPEYLMTVSRNCFLPRPEVDSAVIRLDIYNEEERPVQPRDPEQMFRIIRAAFNQRRKTLMNALSNAGLTGISKENVAEALQNMGISETVRGEALTLAQFAELSDRLLTPCADADGGFSDNKSLFR
ncbi:MAG: 16S rRNA (adenine(1518)-N(6)/adenine(1519)-N(6))-dimethyltransferase RsmA [Parasporobacterium sp.]|nr:16S rRNA (adenine(1518)-N(6)/adenine(1519)-N(6))-dimethyltransferase RsmA [Parasporobacterium sp.]